MLAHCWWECEVIQASALEYRLVVSSNVKHLPYDAAAARLDIQPREKNTYVHTETET